MSENSVQVLSSDDVDNDHDIHVAPVDDSQIFGPGAQVGFADDADENNFDLSVHHFQRRHLTSIRIVPATLILNLAAFFMSMFNRLEEFISESINLNMDYKVCLVAEAQFSVRANNVDLDLEEERRIRSFMFSTNYKVLTTLRESLVDACESLDRKFQKYQDNSSGFRLDGIVQVEVVFIRYNPLTHLRARSFVETPKELIGKHCVVNIVNKYDQRCFIYSILAALHYDEIPNNHNRRLQPNAYLPFLNDVIFDEDQMPMKVKDNDQFERRNHMRFAINVFEWRKKAIRVAQLLGDKVSATSNPFIDVLRVSKNDSHTAIAINLCVISNDEDNNFHYVWIRNMDRFLNCKVEHGNATINIQKKWCDRCVRAFKSQQSLD